MSPQDYLEQATVVISYFVPFTKAHGDQNLKGENDLASPSWAQSYLETNRMIEALNLALAEEIRRLGYHAVVPYGIGMDETLFRRADRRRLRPSEVLSDDLQKSGSLWRRLLRKMRCGPPVLLSGSHKIRIHIIQRHHGSFRGALFCDRGSAASGGVCPLRGITSCSDTAA